MTCRYFFLKNRDFFHPGFLWIVSLVFAFIHSLFNRDAVVHRGDMTPGHPLPSSPVGTGSHVSEMTASPVPSWGLPERLRGHLLQELMTQRVKWWGHKGPREVLNDSQDRNSLRA